MIQWLIKVKRFVFGYEVTPEEKEAHRLEMVKRKAYILGAGAGCAMATDDDGMVRIRSLRAADEGEGTENIKSQRSDSMKQILQAANFAADKHKGQKRKDVNKTPYVNHVLNVSEILATVGKVDDEDILVAALLHDTIEDTGTTEDELCERFGDRVTGFVLEVSDDKSLEKEERKRLQVVNASHKSDGAKQIKIADKISNLRSILSTPPADWDESRKATYFTWANDVFQGLKGVNADLDAEFEATVAKWPSQG